MRLTRTARGLAAHGLLQLFPGFGMQSEEISDTQISTKKISGVKCYHLFLPLKTIVKQPIFTH
jgi:hypothetical protein